MEEELLELDRGEEIPESTECGMLFWLPEMTIFYRSHKFTDLRKIMNSIFHCTTLQPMMNAKLSQQRF